MEPRTLYILCDAVTRTMAIIRAFKTAAELYEFWDRIPKNKGYRTRFGHLVKIRSLTLIISIVTPQPLRFLGDFRQTIISEAEKVAFDLLNDELPEEPEQVWDYDLSTLPKPGEPYGRNELERRMAALPLDYGCWDLRRGIIVTESELTDDELVAALRVNMAKRDRLHGDRYEENLPPRR